MKEKVAVSVIVPVYNVEKYIAKGLRSLLNQILDFKKYEIVIIDDGSTDESLNICKRETENVDNVRILEHKENKGLGPARNTGIKAATGEFLYFIDGDDYIDENALQNLFKLAQEHKADIVTAGFIRVNENGNTLFKQNDYLDLTDDKFNNLNIMLSGQVTHTAWGKLVKKSIFLDNNIYYPKGIHEDVPVTYLLFWYADKIYFSDEVSYYWVKRKASITSYMSKNHIDGWFGAIDQQRKFVERNFRGKKMEQLKGKINTGFLKAAEILLRNIYKYEKDDVHKRILLYEHLFNKIVEQSDQVETEILKKFLSFFKDPDGLNTDSIKKLEVKIN